MKYLHLKKLLKGALSAKLLRYYNNGLRPNPIIAFMEITRKCNNKCQFCDIWKENDDREEISTSRILSLIEEFAKLNIVLIDIFGGEPLLREDLPVILKEIKKYDIKSIVTTNGYLLTERYKELIEAKVDVILVSIDHSRASIHNELRGTDDGYEKAVEGIRLLKQNGSKKLKIGINFLISDKNYNDCLDIIQLAEEMKLDAMRFLPVHQVYPFKDSRADIKNLLNSEQIGILKTQIQGIIKHKKKSKLYFNSEDYLRGIIHYFKGNLEEFSCYAGSLSYDINAYGDVFTCLSRNVPSGNIINASFIDNISSAKNKSLLCRKCNQCWQSCYIEPSMRLSIAKNLHDIFHLSQELSLFNL